MSLNRTYDLPNNQHQTPSKHRSDARTAELRQTSGELGHILGSRMTCVLRTTRIGNVESVMCEQRLFKIHLLSVYQWADIDVFL